MLRFWIATPVICCQSTAPASIGKLHFSQHNSTQNISHIDTKIGLDVNVNTSPWIENQKYSSTLAFWNVGQNFFIFFHRNNIVIVSITNWKISTIIVILMHFSSNAVHMVVTSPLPKHIFVIYETDWFSEVLISNTCGTRFTRILNFFISFTYST